MHWRCPFHRVLDRHTALVHKPLVEIPAHSGATPQTFRQRLLQHGEDRVRVRAVDINLGHEVETLRDVKCRVNKVFDLLVGRELLMELIARECYDRHSVPSVELLQLRVITPCFSS